MQRTQEEHVAVIILNYGKAQDTLECLVSLELVMDPAHTTFLLDNGSPAEDTALLRAYSEKVSSIVFLRSETNLGFAGGCNKALESVLSDPQYTHVLFLNNDVVVTPGFLQKMLAACNPAKKQELVGLRMMSHADPSRVDNLGIAFYAACIASNRKEPRVTYFGPSGGCMLVTRGFVEHVRTISGEFFDEEFFAYAEDTDLCFRALHLGYTPVFVEDAHILHKGSVTSGGKFNEFVMYQGLRNTLWMAVKNVPSGLFLRRIFWILLLHVSVVAKYTIKGKLPLTLRIYSDAFKGLAAMRRKRKKILGTSVRSTKDLLPFMSSAFYEGGYIGQTLRNLFKRDIERSTMLPK